MRRPAHGATRRPPYRRPGNGFGRPLRPGPPARWRDVELLGTARAWDPSELLVEPNRAEADDATAIVTADDATVIHLS
jgi:hypothetical protein